MKTNDNDLFSVEFLPVNNNQIIGTQIISILLCMLQKEKKKKCEKWEIVCITRELYDVFRRFKATIFSSSKIEHFLTFIHFTLNY